MTRRVLITGGAGFVGSNLARHLVNNGDYDVHVLDNFFTGQMSNLDGLDIEVTNGDITDKETVRRCAQGKDIVFHLAARNVIVSGSHPYDDIQTNIVGSYTVFEQCLKADVARIVYTSTSSVYGNARYLPTPENSDFQFLNNYSVSKFAAEGYAECFWEREMLPVTIVRYTNVYGYNQNPSNPYSGVVAKFIHSALSGQQLSIHGDGYQTRDFTFIDDVCEGTLRAGLLSRAIGQTYNLGTGVETRIVDLAQTIIRLCNSASSIGHLDRRDIDNIRRRVLNVEKARLELRHYPQTSLEQGLALTIQHEAEKLAPRP